MAESHVAEIARDMRALEPETRKQIRPALRKAGQILVREVQFRTSWSSRIPRTVRVRTSFRKNREGVDVVMGNNSTPHARPIEHLGKEGTFRHQVYGQDDVYVDQPARPALFPAAIEAQDVMTEEVRGALDTTAAALGFGS